MAEYNGWKNYATWSAAQHINAVEPRYRSAVSFMKSYKGRKPYKDFIASMGLSNHKTGDDVPWLDKSLDYRSLNEMMRDFAPEE